jgi:hypothetical protein
MHTPGPWDIGRNHDHVIEITNNDGRTDSIDPVWILAKINTCMGSESEANAHLIAAAPDLLEIVEMVAHAELRPDFIKHRLMPQALAALRKAKGEA